MKLSERYDAITGQTIIGGEIVRKNVTPEVAKLEEENAELKRENEKAKRLLKAVKSVVGRGFELNEQWIAEADTLLTDTQEEE